nr:Gfo/Idh/MocA family oxidoreductase [Hydrococcus sp. Prado102]
MNQTQKLPLKIGILGTGYAAKRRTEAFQEDDRALVIAVTGNTPENTEAFCKTYSIESCNSWQQLVNHPDIDVVVICNINRDRG